MNSSTIFILLIKRALQHSDKAKPLEVGEVSFAAPVIRAQVFHKLGYLDPKYVIGYAEDTDFCYRARRCNFK
jgi:GT2 family glycosyltransferase